jgi:hypothetical protein
VLESEKIQKEKDLAGAAKTQRSLGAPDCPVVHRTVSGAPGWLLVNWPLSGIRRRRTTKIHQTVRWCTGLSGEPAQSAHDAWPSQWSDGGTGLSGAHRTVRCANGSKSSTVGCASFGKQSAPDTEQCLSGGTPDCPVRHPTEGKNCLP